MSSQERSNAPGAARPSVTVPVNIHAVLKRPIVTEKTTRGTDIGGVYVFEVDPHANKLLVRRAVEDLFGVKVTKVNIRVRKGKEKRMGRSSGFGADRKEALVTILPGQKIDVY
jgi:large subunit ribosomal protein L23